MSVASKILHMIGNAHIDPVWLWQWQEGFHEVKASFRSALDRMNEYADFKFVSSSAVFYEWVEQSDPKMFEEIRTRVKEGRWEIVGGWWLQPDCNIPSGESFVRQALYGQHYFKKKFGITATVGYNVDSFGHHGMLPQILKKSGCDYYVAMRPFPNEMGLPGSVFWWESDDGSRVLTFRIPFMYQTSDIDLEKHVISCASEIKAPHEDIMCFYGVGNHGGGPTKRNIEEIQRLQKTDNGIDLIFSTPNQFFDKISKNDITYPVVHQDLQHHASGCYAVHSEVKYWNRRAENRLLAAEKFAMIASLITGQPYPDDFGRAWKSVLFNQFHDILAGTSIEPAYDDARNLYGEALAIADRALNFAIQSLSWNIQILYEEGVKPITVFNSHAWKHQTNVELEIGELPENPVLLNEDGVEISMQLIQSYAQHPRANRLSFMADLPALGYSTYRVMSGKLTVQNSESDVIQATSTMLENTYLRLIIDSETGLIQSLYDLEKDVEVFSSPAARPVVIEDSSDTWGHNVLQFHDTVGMFSVERVDLVEHGPVKATIRVTSVYGHSRLIQDFTMYTEQKRIDVSATVAWSEQFKMLKLRFPVNLDFNRVTYEIPYGYIERPANGEEEPGQNWIDVSGLYPETRTLYGLSILNDGKYSFDVLGAEIGITVLRSPIYAHHIPVEPHPDREYSFIDQGIQRFRYALLPHDGGWELCETVRRAAEFNELPATLIGTFHQGELPQKQGFIEVDASNIVISVIKKAEENDDIILRCYETDKRSTQAVIHLKVLDRRIETSFQPCEIKTFRIPRNHAQAVTEVNLLEW
jgi:alpha-mannosidase